MSQLFLVAHTIAGDAVDVLAGADNGRGPELGGGGSGHDGMVLRILREGMSGGIEMGRTATKANARGMSYEKCGSDMMHDAVDMGMDGLLVALGPLADVDAVQGSREH